MAYTNKVPRAAAFATVVLFLAVTMEAQPTPKVDPVCAFVITDVVKICYLTLSLVPSEECCKDLKLGNQREVNCLCNNFIAHPSNASFTRDFFDQVHNACGVLDKYACKGEEANRGATNKIATSMGLFGLVATLFL